MSTVEYRGYIGEKVSIQESTEEYRKLQGSTREYRRVYRLTSKIGFQGIIINIQFGKLSPKEVLKKVSVLGIAHVYSARVEAALKN